MRQAILITAYRDMPQLRRLVDWFDADFELFIHLDKRCREDISWMNGRSNLHLYRDYAIEWGDYRHLKAIVLLMREAYTHTGLEYFHLISTRYILRSWTTILSISLCRMLTGAQKEA